MKARSCARQHAFKATLMMLQLQAGEMRRARLERSQALPQGGNVPQGNRGRIKEVCQLWVATSLACSSLSPCSWCGGAAPQRAMLLLKLLLTCSHAHDTSIFFCHDSEMGLMINGELDAVSGENSMPNRAWE